jgi:hypothetical protein
MKTEPTKAELIQGIESLLDFESAMAISSSAEARRLKIKYPNDQYCDWHEGLAHARQESAARLARILGRAILVDEREFAKNKRCAYAMNPTQRTFYREYYSLINFEDLDRPEQAVAA